MMVVTKFENVWAKTAEAKDMTWERLVHRICNPKMYEAKTDMPLLKLAKFGDQKNAKGTLRYDDNVLSVSGLEGDYDGEVVSITEAAEKLRSHGVKALLYTSPSHTQDKPRWRVLAPLSEDKKPGDRSRYTGMLNEVLGGILAKESHTLSQTYYYGRTQAHYEAIEVKGEPIDLLNVEEPEPANDSNVIALPTARSMRIADAISEIYGNEGYYQPSLSLAAMLFNSGMQAEDAKMAVKAIMEAHPNPNGDIDKYIDKVDSFLAGESFKKVVETSRIKRVDLTDLENQHIAPKDFVVPNWLPRGVVTLFAGNGGTGKSYISLQAGVLMAAGLQVFGEYVPKREKVMYISAEDSEEVLKFRTKSYLKHLGVSSSEVADNLILMDWSDITNPALFANTNRAEGKFTEMFAQLTKLVEEEEITVLILDNSSILYAGEEQTRSMVQTFIGGLKTMYQGLAVLLMHHVNRGTVSGSDAQTYSGSTGWHNGVRARWSLTETRGARVLKLEKNNYGKSGFEIPIAYSDAEHCFTWGLPMDSSASATSVADVVLQIIQDLYLSNVFLSPSSNVHNEAGAKKAISNHHKFPAHVHPKTVHPSIDDLKRRGLVAVEEYTKDYKPRQRLVVTEAGETYLTEGAADEFQ